MIGIKTDGLEKVKIALCPPLLLFDFLLAKWPLFDVFDDFDVLLIFKYVYNLYNFLDLLNLLMVILFEWLYINFDIVSYDVDKVK